MSQAVEKVSGLKLPKFITPGPVSMDADGGVCWSWVGESGGAADSGGSYLRGSNGCVQDFPWLTQMLQKPQSPPLQRSHLQ
jgi:hypothetical protein